VEELVGCRHVWVFNPHGNQRSYDLALMRITNILDNSFMIVANTRGDPNTEPYTKSFIIFNGVAPHIGEHFYLPQTLKETTGYYSCNTRKEPYDSFVKACLVTLYDYIGDDIQIYSDDDFKAWRTGIDIAGGVDLKLRSMEDFDEGKFRS
jgi:hypothetical protein